MLHRYTDPERTVVRNKYGQHVMMRVAETSCRLFGKELQNISLWPEELFVWAAVIMDDVKEKGDEYMTRIGDLWQEHYSRLRVLDKSVSDEERQLAASIILYVPVLMLQTSNDSVHRYMGKQMLDQVSMNYDLWEETFTKMANACQRMMPKMGEWVNDFMALENDLYLSDEIEDSLGSRDEGSGKQPATVVNVTVQAGAEYVQEKIVEKNVEKVEAGGIGVQVVQGSVKSPVASGRKPACKVVSSVFTYKWAKQHPERVVDFYQALVRLHAIDQDTDHEEFEKLFTGVPTDIMVRWLAPKSALKALMSELKKREYIMPAGRLWVITESHFKDKDNKIITGLRSEKDPKYLEPMITIIADTLDPKKNVKPINMLDDDMAQELWYGIKDRGWDLNG